MSWILLISALILAGGYVYFLFARGDIPAVLRALRWILGGGALAVAALLGAGGRVGPASLLGLIGSSILFRGRLGPIDFNPTGTARGAKSKVRSRYFEMQLDHDSSSVEGRVIAGNFAGSDLIDIGEDDMRQLLGEVAHDPDSLSLLEAWLDANRSGWREYFDYGGSKGEQTEAGGGRRASQSAELDAEQAYDILGLKPGASDKDIKAAHHRLLKAVHPDQGGSNFLAARINAAKDFLLKKKN